MRRLFPAALCAAAAALATGCGGSSGGSSGTDTNAGSDTTEATMGGGSGTLTGSVGPDFEISMAETSAPAGTYTLTVDDKASHHNFHLTGPGVDVQTNVVEIGQKTFTITLQEGEYRFQCDPHASKMNGTLTVT